MKPPTAKGQFFSRILQEAGARWDTAVVRPWGSFVVLRDIVRTGAVIYREKLLRIYPNTMLTLHTHSNYDEVWLAEDGFDYILEGERGGLTKCHAVAYERVFIPRKRKHLISTGVGELCVFEIQLGNIVDSDVVKFTLPEDIAANSTDRIE